MSVWLLNFAVVVLADPMVSAVEVLMSDGFVCVDDMMRGFASTMVAWSFEESEVPGSVEDEMAIFGIESDWRGGPSLYGDCSSSSRARPVGHMRSDIFKY